MKVMNKPMTIKNLITSKAISVSPETSLVEAANILSKHHFNGLPVVDKENVLVGIVTEQDFLTKGSAIHLPTFLKLFEGIEIYRNDAMTLSGDIKKILGMRVKDVMNSDPLTLREGATVEEALKAFAEHHRVNPIPIVDENKKLKGVLSRHDIIKMFGSSSAVVDEKEMGGSIDRNVNAFIADFEKQFLLVSRTRTRYWLLWSIFFIMIGFLIAFALIVRFGPGQ